MGGRGHDDRPSIGEYVKNEYGEVPFRVPWGKVIACFIGFVLAVSVLGFFGGWFEETKKSASAGNAKEQTTVLINDYESLRATAGNICSARNAEHDESDPQIVENPEFAYEATYRRIAAEYDRIMANYFEGGIVKRYPQLNGYPDRAPSIEEMLVEIKCENR